MPLKLSSSIARKIATGLAGGLSGTAAYLGARPYVSRDSATALGSLAKKDPMVLRHLEKITARQEQSDALTRTQVQKLLTLAATTPKTLEALQAPENAWLITQQSETANGRRSIQGISALEALKELSKVSGYYAAPTASPKPETCPLSESAEYAELLLQELQLLAARSGREKKAEEAICLVNAEEEAAFDLSWLD